MRQCSISIPGKLMLLGEHAVVYGFPCIVSSVNKYLEVCAEKINSGKDEFITPQVSDHLFLLSALNIFRHKFSLKETVKITTKSNLGNFGLGSSSAVTVGVINSLSKLFDITLTKKELFSLSYKAVLKAQKRASGFDVACAIYKGTIYFDGKTKEIMPLDNKVLPLIVSYCGQKGKTVEMVEKVAKLKSEKPKLVGRIFLSINSLVKQAVPTINIRNWRNLGQLMTQNHKQLIKLGVSTKMLDKMVETSVNAGAYGAKLSGAGGGDCIIAAVSDDKKEQVKKAIEKIGGQVLDLKVGI